MIVTIDGRQADVETRFLVDGQEVDLDAYRREFVARGKTADVARAFARISDDARRTA